MNLETLTRTSEMALKEAPARMPADSRPYTRRATGAKLREETSISKYFRFRRAVNPKRWEIRAA
jgi:hypothetical protein